MSEKQGCNGYAVGSLERTVYYAQLSACKYGVMPTAIKQVIRDIGSVLGEDAIARICKAASQANSSESGHREGVA